MTVSVDTERGVDGPYPEGENTLHRELYYAQECLFRSSKFSLICAPQMIHGDVARPICQDHLQFRRAETTRFLNFFTMPHLAGR